VFTSEFDDYIIVIRSLGTAYTGINYRLRASGSDNSTANSYVVQQLSAVSTTVSAARLAASTLALGGAGAISSSQRGGATIYVYGPALAQPTAVRTVSITGEAGADLWDYASTHNQSTAYDGITLYPDSGTFTGLVTVYGLAQ
jgi:hypothetical protein